MDKETEMRERTKESKDKESSSLALSARTREELQLMARTIPTIDQVLSHAHTIMGFRDDGFIRDWYRQMNAVFWCDEFGNQIKNWAWVLNKWRHNRKLFDRLRDPERIPDARKSGGRRKSDNWRGTKSEEVGDVLG